MVTSASDDRLQPLDVIVGNSADNVLPGTSRADDIRGLGGADRLLGRGGKDVLRGGSGNDDLLGGGGADTLIGGAGADTLRGGGGADRLFGDADNDVLIGGAGADVYLVRPGNHGLDSVRGFNINGGDKLDVRLALTGYGSGDYIVDFVRARLDGDSTIVSISPTGAEDAFTDVLRLEGRALSLDQLAYRGMNMAPLDASQLRTVQEDPYNFTNTSDNNANPRIAPSGRFVAFASQENLDGRQGDPQASGGDEETATHDIFVQDFRSGALVRASVAADGGLVRTPDGALAEFASPAISANGRFVAFATNGVLSPQDTNDSADVYRKDLVTGNVTLVSATAAGGPAAGGAALSELEESGASVAMSANGRFVAFMTTAALDPARDGNQAFDLYVRDLGNDQVFLASLNSAGRAGGVLDSFGFLLDPAIDMSASGRFVAFTTNAALDPADANGQADVYVWDRLEPLSTPMLASAGAEPPPGFPPNSTPNLPLSSSSALSADGRFVVFESSAALTADDTNGVRDIYRYDLTNDAIVRVSVDSQGRETAVEGSFDPAISSDGRFVAFSSAAGDLVLGDTSFGFTDRAFSGTPFPEDIFVKDLLTGAITRASVDDNGIEADGTSFSPSLSGNGRLAAFLSDAPNLLDPQSGLAPGDSLVLTEVDFQPAGAVDVPANPAGAVNIERNFLFSPANGFDVPEASPDIPLNFALRNTIDQAGDRDWFEVSLFGGHSYTIALQGNPTGQGTLANPLLGLHDSTGQLVTANDDGGAGLNARLVFQPDADGVFYISAEGSGNAAGSYRLLVQDADPPLALAAARSSLNLAEVLDAAPGDGPEAGVPDAASPNPLGSASVAAAGPAGDVAGALANLLADPGDTATAG